jgi:hypothetical protein
MAGYSGTPLPQKLGIKEGARVGLVRAPAGFARTLGPLPVGVVPEVVGRGTQAFDVMICFVTRAADVGRELAALKQRMTPAAGLWMAWPKRASGVETDLDENVIRGHGLAAGLVDNKVCAVDETWSGLRFVIRLADRPPRAKAAKPSRR